MIRLSCFVVFTVALTGMAAISHATLFSYTASLSGPNEASPNTSPGTGTALVDYDDQARTLRVQVSFSGLEAVTTAAHIHGPTTTPGTGAANVITATPSFPGFPLGVTSGIFDNTFDLTLASSWNSSFITANGGSISNAEAALATALAEARTYLNIHSQMYGGGEIRGFLVPEPAMSGLIAVAMLALFGRRRRVSQ